MTTNPTNTLGIPPCPAWVDLERAFGAEYLDSIRVAIAEVLDGYRTFGPRLREMAAKIKQLEDGFDGVCESRTLGDNAYELLSELSGIRAMADAWALLTGLTPNGDALTEIGMKEARERFGIDDE